MSILLIDDLEWHDVTDGLPAVGTKCYIKIAKYDERGEKAPVYDIVAVEVHESLMPHNYGAKFFYRSGDFKRNVFMPTDITGKDVEAWAEVPKGDVSIRQLLPCPFCGGKATLHHEEAYEDDYGDMPEHWWVGCDDGVIGRKKCPMIVQTGLFLSKEKAIDAWNTRHRNM